MNFQNPEIQKYYERSLALSGGLPEEQRPVFALMDIYGWFRMHGEESPEALEIIAHLLDPELREGLRSWYRKSPESNCNSAANDFRRRLSELAGEEFPR